MDEDGMIDLSVELKEALHRLKQLGNMLNSELCTQDLALVTVIALQMLKFIGDRSLEVEFCSEFMQMLRDHQANQN